MAFKQFGYIVLLFVLAGLYAVLCSSDVDGFQSDSGMRCDRSLWEEEATKKPDIGFRIRMDTNLVLYAPEKKYDVFLEAAIENSRFTKFVLTVDSLNHSDPGSFELQNNVLTEFSRVCPNTIVQTSFIPKTAIAVVWKAPPVDSGCVQIRGLAYDTSEALHHGGNLTLKLCQGELDGPALPEILKICGACSEASYQMIFEGLWSRQTHPKDFPQYLFDTSFDGIIGASHSNDFRLWEFNKNASDGIAELAETGKTKQLETEIKSQSEQIRTVIKAKGLTHPNRNSRTYAIFRTDDKNHLLSLITKFSPSPDWVVGVSALELCLANNSWAVSRVVNLYPIDAGTVDGVSYKVDKVHTMPRAAIRLISVTENPESPFYSETGEIQPLAKVMINRQRVFGKGKCITDGYSHNNHRCAVTAWIDDGPCNCRIGIQRRRRTYKNPNDRYNRNCNMLLVQELPCTCGQTLPPGNAAYTTYDHLSSTYYQGSCDTTEWGSWTECTCQTPYRSRRRYYKNSVSAHGCMKVMLEQDDCIDMPECGTPTNGGCAVTEWSEWSPCNATCEMTMGMRMRTRLFFNPAVNITSCNVHTIETEPCRSERTDCNGAPNEICFEPKLEGPCHGYFSHWYYNPHEGRCQQFVYGGCRGNRNNFKTYAECNRICGNVFRGPPPNVSILPPPDDPNLVVDCKLTEWAPWSECSSTCGVAWKDRRRKVEVNAQNGGEPCSTKLYQRKKCKVQRPCDIIY